MAVKNIIGHGIGFTDAGEGVRWIPTRGFGSEVAVVEADAGIGYRGLVTPKRKAQLGKTREETDDEEFEELLALFL